MRYFLLIHRLSGPYLSKSSKAFSFHGTTRSVSPHEEQGVELDAPRQLANWAWLRQNRRPADHSLVVD